MPFLLAFLSVTGGAFGQSQVDHVRSDYVKTLTIESFGYNSAPTGPGFDSPTRLTTGPFTSSGLECPLCLIRPVMERTRYTLPPFGAQVTWKLWQGRVELFTGFGGINVWKPDNTLPDPNRRGSSFNDAWLMQAEAGGWVAVDRDRHLWLGAAGRYLQDLGEGKNTGTATEQAPPSNSDVSQAPFYAKTKVKRLNDREQKRF